MPKRALGGLLIVAAALLLAPRAAPIVYDDTSVDLGDVVRGWGVFHEKRCAKCHAIWGQGGQIGPDLGRTYGGHLSANELAGGMWNHVPRMLSLMRQYRLPNITLTREEMADIFSLLYFVRYLDEPGDPREGRRVLEQRGCVGCHEEELEQGEDEIGPRLTRWSGFVNPIVWAQMMWEHSAGMEKAMKQRGMEWPELRDDDLSNIIAYVRSASASGPKTYLKPGSPARGQGLFAERKCAQCHVTGGGPKEKGPDLSRIELPRSLSALAGRMWNHLPQMRKAAAEQNLDAVSLTAQDMADIIAYLFAKQYEGEPGDAARGRDVFNDKRCVECHLLAAADEGGERSSAVGMGHAIWQHGARMAEEMAQAAIPWPTFEGTEMADLIVYIKSIGKLIVKEEVALRGMSDSAKQKNEK